MVVLKIIGFLVIGFIVLTLFYLLLLPIGAIILINWRYKAAQNGVEIFQAFER